jgi:hypothetical protein
MPLFTLQKASSCFHKSHQQRSQACWVIHFHALSGVAAASEEKMQTTVSAYSEHTANQKQKYNLS